ncbi:MAG: hypothetical protein ABSB22_10845 [Thermodesulfobacteriota bacterium]
MGKKLMTTKGRLRWFLDLINADIDSQTITISEIIRYWEQIREIAYGSLGLWAISDRDLMKWKEKRDELKKIQCLLRDFLQKVLSGSKKPKKIMIRPLYGVTENMERALEKPEEPGISEVEPALTSIIYSKTKGQPLSTFAEDYIAFTFKPEIAILVGREKVAMIYSRIEEKLLSEFVSVLSQFSLNSVRKCQREDCGAYFLRATKKEKRYCSNKCAWVMASRERRKKQPEKERQKKRESYYQRRRKEFGQKVRIQKKGRKEG